MATAIVSSVRSVSAPQVDGRSYVSEQHTDGSGYVWAFEYLADIGANYDAIMAARASDLAAWLADQEATQLSGQ